MAKKDLEIETGDGTAKASLFSPEGREPERGVIVYMDAFGPRTALEEMGQRFAAAGYAALVPDLFYRFAPYGPFDPATAFAAGSATRTEIFKMMKGTTQAATARDTAAFIDALASRGATGIGVVGYCMGGARALRAAAEYPGSIRAAASFHGGNLASEAEDSPHRFLDRARARVYVGTAETDRSFPPEQAARLAGALRQARLDHIIENYPGCAHGWTIPDNRAYDRAGAERHWARVLRFLDEAWC